MESIKKDSILQEIPLFAGLSSKEQAIITKRSSLVEYKKGEIVYLQNSPPDAFYCVVLGRVVIYAQGTDRGESILEYLHRGKYFGIISLLTGEAHSVTAKAINDSALLVIKKEDFDYILKKIPHLAIDLSLTLSRRLKNKDVHQKTIFESTVVSVFSSYAAAGKTIYALNLALSLKKETRKSVIVLDIIPRNKKYTLPLRLGLKEECKIFDLFSSESDPIKNIREYVTHSEFGIDIVCFYYQEHEELCSKKLLSVLTTLVNDYHYIILDLPVSVDSCIFSILNQSDVIHILSSSDSEDLKKTGNLVNRLKEEVNFQEQKIKIIINENKASEVTPQEQKDILRCNIYANLPKIELTAKDRLVLEEPDSQYAKALRRISRQLSDSFVGLALGVGLGYGFCHIGVLKVIEEEGIPIDVISGASIGSVIGSLWAAGYSAGEIAKITNEFNEPRFLFRLVDLTIPTLGFIKGNNLYRFLKKYLGNKTFYDCKLPLKIVASDVRRKESKVFESGSLLDAVMASCSMPGIFRPFRFKEGLILDGGIINPLPTEVLFKMGVKKIIAVNVTPSREDIQNQYQVFKEQITQTYDAVKKKEWFSIKKFFRERLKNNILDIIFSSVEVMQAEMVEQEARLADIVIHPNLTGLHWLELHRSAEFLKRGEEEARKNLDKIWKVIND